VGVYLESNIEKFRSLGASSQEPERPTIVEEVCLALGPAFVDAARLLLLCRLPRQQRLPHSTDQGPWQLCWSGGDEEQEAHTLESLSKNVQKKEIVDPLLITESPV